MTQTATAFKPHPQPPAPLARRFEAVIFDWDGTAVPDRNADAAHLRQLVEDACAAGIELVIVSGTHIGNVDGQLRARPSGPGRLLLALNRGSEVFAVDHTGPHLRQRRTATDQEQSALDRAAELTVERLAARGLRAEIVSQRLNRRKIDVIPDPAWSDPPKARIAELLVAVEARLAAAGIAGLTEAVRIARDAAADAGLADPRVTSDAKHVEIGLTDKTDSASWINDQLWHIGIEPGQVLIVGDELGPLGGLQGSDSNLLIDGATAVSVGVEPNGVPSGVISLGGGPDAFAALLQDQIARRQAGELPQVGADPMWTLTIGQAQSPLERVHESLLAIADGTLGTRGTMLVSDPAEDPGVLLAGIYTGQGPDTQLLGAPAWSMIELSGDDHAVRRTSRTLDLRTGTLSQELAGDGASLRALQLSSLARPGSAVLRVRGEGTTLRLPSGLQAPPDAESESGEKDGCSWMRITGSPGSIVAASCEHVLHQQSGARHGWLFDKVACYEGTPDGVADHRAALRRLDELRPLGFERLLCEHRRAWAKRWEHADIGITGDPELQFATRFALFHMIASVADQGEAAVGARGLTGAGYHGHVFWDSDVYVLPFLAATESRAARAMLEYRVRRLPVALEAARAQRRAGARFPWESAARGDDVTPTSARNPSGETVPIYTGQLEEHIVADVAWAAAHYIDWTDDRAFAAGPGLELLVQTARWWASRIERDADGSAHIRHVIGPDEYHEPVDDNAYTNVMARWNLRRAAAAAQTANGEVLDRAERHRWLGLADALVDGYDAATGIYEQFAGFHELEPLLIAELAPHRPVAADVLLGQERTAGAQVVKQADVLMLHYLVPDEVAAGSLAPNLDYYEPRTAHGSTLSAGVHAALMARSGQIDQAIELLRLTARIDLDDIGDSTAAGPHLAAMGSVWRALTFGFAGLRPVGDALAIDPVLAAGWESLQARVTFRGSHIKIRVQPGRVELSADQPVDMLTPGGERLRLDRSTQSFELATPRKQSTP